MLDPDEQQAVAAQFGATAEQVRRDHLISHILAALSQHTADQVLFFGGTALSRTLVPDGRLSEDIDLIALDNRSHTAALLERELPRALRHEYPDATWQPPLTRVRGSDPAILHTPDGTVVRIQLLSRTGYPTWPTRHADLVQRYSDAPPATLTVPTAPAFVAWKTIAWLDRHTPRDLYDLWLLAGAGHVTADAAALFAEHGPTNRAPRPEHFTPAPTDDQWRRELAEQTHLTITADDALAHVHHAWRHAG